MTDAVEFIYNPQKSERLREMRGLGFEEIIEYIEDGYVLDIYPYHDQEKYPHEQMYVVNVNGYAWLVPLVLRDNVAHLKTLYPSRTATKKYIGRKA